ncbi:MAG: pentapeptide repeat-containing protein [Pseudomonadota bacterium]
MRKKILYFFILTFLPIAVFAATPYQRTVLAKKICQCPRCNLQYTDFKNYQYQTPVKKDAHCSIRCDFNGTDFAHANMHGINFTTCVRGYVTYLKSASFVNSIFEYADLTRANFTGVNLNQANFSYANLSHAKFFLSDLSHTNFTHANLSYAQSRRDAMHGWGSDFSFADFSFAVLYRANLYGNFQYANFSHADLQHARIQTDLDVFQHPLTENQLFEGTDFSYANLRFAKILTSSRGQPNLNRAILCHTIMPNGKENNRDCQFEKKQFPTNLFKPLIRSSTSSNPENSSNSSY